MTFCFVMVCLLAPEIGLSQSNYIRFNEIDEVIQKWDTDQTLFLQGSIGVSDEQLSNLSKWLNTNGPHWTIVLMETAAGQSYRTNAGSNFIGMDAVEHALGHGLSNQTDFGLLQNETTGESDGAIFVLFLRERKFSYFASDAQDRRRLGESHWIGDLDQQAIEAMRNGGRIVDAVKNTVTSVDRRLKSTIEHELAQERQRQKDIELAKEAAERNVLYLKERFRELRDIRLPEIETEAAAFLKAFPNAVTSVINPSPVSALTEQLQKLENILTTENVATVQQDFSALVEDINSVFNAYHSFLGFEIQFAALDRRCDTLAFRTGTKEGEQASVEIREMLDNAQVAYRAGNPEFVNLLARSEEKLKSVEAAVQGILEKRATELASVQERRSWIWKTLVVVGAAIGSVSFFIGLILNWRRRKTMQVAVAEFEKRDRLSFELEKSVSELVGRRDMLLTGGLDAFQNRYEGETTRLAERINSLTSRAERGTQEIQRVTDQVHSTLFPRSPLAQFVNLISSARYHAAIALLSKATMNASILESDESASAALQWTSFDQFSQTLTNNNTHLERMMDRLKAAVDTADDDLKNLRVQINRLNQEQQRLENESDRDSWLRVDSFEDHFLPELTSQHLLALSKLSRDPLFVKEQLVPNMTKMADDAFSLIARIDDVRGRVLPAALKMREEFERRANRSEWIRERLVAMGSQLNNLFEVATKERIEKPLQYLSEEIALFETDSSELLRIADLIDEDLKDAYDRSISDVAETRSRIATHLGINSNEVMRDACDPDLQLNIAKKQAVATSSAIDRGALSAAQESMQEIEIALKLANEWNQAAEKAVSEFPKLESDGEGLHKQVSELLPVVRQKIDEAIRRYLPSAVILRPAELDENSIDSVSSPVDQLLSGKSIDRVWQNASSQFHVALEDMQRTKARFKAGNVLTAANDLGLIVDELRIALESLGQCRFHCENLELQRDENIEVASGLLRDFSVLIGEMQDSRIQQSTLDEAMTAQKELESFAAVLKRELKDSIRFWMSRS
ncbi:MAG: hypothetical protein R3C03_03660 [Pirellulaceae bacterium]